MSQIETLYAGSSAVVEDHIVIGKDRIVRVPNNLKRIAVQYDHNIETVTFDCPRYWDGLDMSKMVVYINYLCADRQSGTYRVKNVTPDKYYVDTMHFDWIISRNVTTAAGKIAFQVCIKKTDGEGNEVNHWNSEVYRDCHVSESLNCGDAELNEVYPDIFEQWHKEWVDYVYSGEFTGPPGVSPTVTITDIEGGRRITITDINGSEHFDVIDPSAEVLETIEDLVKRMNVKFGQDEPTEGPALWFNVTKTVAGGSSSGVSGSHAYGTIKFKDENGGIRTFYPTTDSSSIEGILDISHGGTGASNATKALEKLGAAPTNHTHGSYENSIKTLQSYFSDGGALHMNVQGCNDTDLNTLVEQGIYAGYTGMTNAAANDISIIEVMPYSNDWIIQRQTVISSIPAKSATYIRFRYSGTTWTPWRRMLSNILHPDDYGVRDTADGLPADAVKGQIFFKKVVE